MGLLIQNPGIWEDPTGCSGKDVTSYDLDWQVNEWGIRGTNWERLISTAPAQKVRASLKGTEGEETFSPEKDDFLFLYKLDS